MHKVVNTINNAFRYNKNSFKLKKNSKTVLFLKCLVKSNIIRYFKEIKSETSNEVLILGFINPLNMFEIKLVSKSGRKIYIGNQNIKSEIDCFFILSNNKNKKYISNFDFKNQTSGELVAKIFI